MGDEKDGPRPVPSGDMTMQLDAMAPELDIRDSVEDVQDGANAAVEAPRAVVAPPPLPAKRSGRGNGLVIALVVLVMAGLGVAVGLVLLGGGTPPADPPPPAVTQPPATKRAPRVVDIGEVVVGGSEAPAPPPAPAPTTPE